MGQLKKVFQVNRQGFKLTRGLVIVGVLLVPFIVLSVIHQEKYWLSVSFAALFLGICDPGVPMESASRVWPRSAWPVAF